ARLRLVPASDEGLAVWTPRTVEADGTFRLVASAPGRHLLVVDPPGSRWAAPRPRWVDPPARGLTLVAPAPASIAGRIEGALDVAHVLIEATVEGAAALAPARAGKVAADGTFRIDGLGEGPWALLARSPGEGRYALATGLAPGAEGVVLSLVPALRLEGEIRTAAGQVPEGIVFVRARGESGTFSTQVEKDGLFAFGALPPGRYRLQTLPVNRTRWSKAIEVEAGRTDVRLTLP
ncbi:MAG: carboxypeptidase-like regulatory domain-containing protein, partial [Planctomycetota bacterium]